MEPQRGGRGGKGRGGSPARGKKKKKAHEGRYAHKHQEKLRGRGRGGRSRGRGGGLGRMSLSDSSSDSEVDAAVLADYLEHTLSDTDQDERGKVPERVVRTMQRISSALPAAPYSPPSPSPSPPPPPALGAGHAPSSAPHSRQPLSKRGGRGRRGSRGGGVTGGRISFVTAGLLSDVALEIAPMELAASVPTAPTTTPTTPFSVTAPITVSSSSPSSSSSLSITIPRPDSVCATPALVTSSTSPLSSAPTAVRRAAPHHPMHVVGGGAEDEEAEDEGGEDDEEEEEEEEDDDDDDDELGADDEAEDGEDDKGEVELIVVDSNSEEEGGESGKDDDAEDDDDDDGDDDDDDDLDGAEIPDLGDFSDSSSEDLIVRGRLQVALNAALSASVASPPAFALPAAVPLGALGTDAPVTKAPSKRDKKKKWRRLERLEKQKERSHKHGMRDNEEDAATVLTTVRALHREMRSYVAMGEENAPLALTPTSRTAHFACLTLARLYGLKARAHGRQRSKYLMLTKGKHTEFADARALSAFFASLAPSKDEESIDAAAPRHEKKSKQLRRARRAATGEARAGRGARIGGGGGGGTGGIGSGGVVGAGAAAVGEENVGHRLLVGMGWTGGGLGREGEGITEPLPAFQRNSRAGLGL